jgi:MFS family permease
MRQLDFLRLNAPFLSAGFLLTFGSAFGQTFFISIFAGEIRAEFGLTHAAWGGIYALGTTASAIVMVWAGGLTDVFRVRVIGAVTLLLLMASCLFMAWNVSAALLPVVIFALRFSGQGMMSHIGTVAMARWFVGARGKALSVASLGFSLAEASLPVIFVALMAIFDWRLLWVVAAGGALVLLPILLRLLRLERTPSAVAAETEAFGLEGRHWRRNEVLRHRMFWLLIPALLAPPAFNTAFFFQQVQFAEVKDWAHLELVAFFPIYTLSAVSAMVVSGLLIDRFGTARIMPVYQLPFAVAFVIFSFAQTPLQALPAFVCLGVSTGVNATLPAAFWAEFYGTRYIGSIKAMASAIMVLGSAIGPGVTGYLITAGLGLETQMLGISLVFVIASALVAIGIASAIRSGTAAA